MSDADKNKTSPGGRPDAPDPIGALLRASGRRPPIPPEREARVRSAVHAHWRDGVASRRASRHRSWTAALAAAAAVVALAVGLFWRPGAFLPFRQEVGRIDVVTGPVRRGHGSASPAMLRTRDRLFAGQFVQTAAGGRAAIRLGSGHSLRLDGNTSLRLISERVLGLDRGAVYLDSGIAPASGRASLVVRTSFGDVRDIGTQFETRLGRSLLIRVREGRIVLSRHDHGPLEVAAGEEMTLDEGGPVGRRPIDPYDAAWSWVAEIVPALDLEGRTLSEFLEWAARERGVRVAFASDDLAGEAPGIRLDGSIEGMSLDDALASVLLTCDMTYALQDGVLMVSRSAGSAP